MFKISIAAIALIGGSQAIRYRPLPGTAVWHKEADLGGVHDPEYPYNYKVPNFGADTDIKMSQANMEEAEKKIGPMTASFHKPKDHPKDYFVPNFGVDEDITNTQDQIKKSEKRLGRPWKPE